MTAVEIFSPAAIPVPAIVSDAGASERFLEFFAATIRNPNTRAAYLKSVLRFSTWCEHHAIALLALRPLHVATYVEQLGRDLSKPSVKQHLAGIRQLLDYLVTRGVLALNPAASVRGPTYVIKKGKTPVLSAEEVRLLFASIETDTIINLRDRALIAVMAYSFARIGAVLAMNVEDFAHQGRRATLRLHEKGGKYHEVPAHHKIEQYLDAYIEAAGIGSHKGTPLFRTVDAKRRLTESRLQPREALAMIKRRSAAAGLGDSISCHSFRASGITNYMENGGTLARAQAIAAHASPRTTMLYDRSNDSLTLDEIERVRF
jgi:integrase/recombinase XerD